MAQLLSSAPSRSREHLHSTGGGSIKSPAPKIAIISMLEGRRAASKQPYSSAARGPMWSVWDDTHCCSDVHAACISTYLLLCRFGEGSFGIGTACNRFEEDPFAATLNQVLPTLLVCQPPVSRGSGGESGPWPLRTRHSKRRRRRVPHCRTYGLTRQNGDQLVYIQGLADAIKRIPKFQS